jgi:hypothetical protein
MASDYVNPELFADAPGIEMLQYQPDLFGGTLENANFPGWYATYPQWFDGNHEDPLTAPTHYAPIYLQQPEMMHVDPSAGFHHLTDMTDPQQPMNMNGCQQLMYTGPAEQPMTFGLAAPPSLSPASSSSMDSSFDGTSPQSVRITFRIPSRRAAQTNQENQDVNSLSEQELLDLQLMPPPPRPPPSVARTSSAASSPVDATTRGTSPGPRRLVLLSDDIQAASALARLEKVAVERQIRSLRTPRLDLITGATAHPLVGRGQPTVG